MEATRNTIEIHISPGKIAKLIVFCIVFIAGGLWLLIKQPHVGNPVFDNPVLKYGSAAGCVAMGALGLVIYTRRLFVKTPQIVINSEGIHYISPFIKYGLIPWKDIKSTHQVIIKKQKFIALTLHNAEEYVSSLKGYTRTTAKWNINQYGTPVLFVTSDLDCTTDELEGYIKSYLVA